MFQEVERLETEILELTERYVDLEAQNVRLQEQISCFDELQEKVSYQYMLFIFACVFTHQRIGAKWCIYASANYRHLSNIRFTFDITRTPTLGNSQLEFSLTTLRWHHDGHDSV